MTNEFVSEPNRGPSALALSLMAAAAASVATVGIMSSFNGSHEHPDTITSTVAESSYTYPANTGDAEEEFVTRKPTTKNVETVSEPTDGFFGNDNNVGHDDPWEDDCPACGLG